MGGSSHGLVCGLSAHGQTGLQMDRGHVNGARLSQRQVPKGMDELQVRAALGWSACRWAPWAGLEAALGCSLVRTAHRASIWRSSPMLAQGARLITPKERRCFETVCNSWNSIPVSSTRKKALVLNQGGTICYLLLKMICNTIQFPLSKSIEVKR